MCNLSELSPQLRQRLLQLTAAGDVWGVGRRIGAQLAEAGILTAWDLSQLDLGMVRRRWSVTLERTVRELGGQSCIELESAPSPKQSIACTRSFGHPVSELEPLLEAVSTFASRAAERLRKQDGRCGQLQVFAHSSPHRAGPRFSRSIMVPLVRPTADTRLLVGAAVAGARRIYAPGHELSKAGVLLLDIVGPEVVQGELALEPPVADRSRLMCTMDALNQRYGKGTVHVAGTGQASTSSWGVRQERRTPRYTTELSEIPVARA